MHAMCYASIILIEDEGELNWFVYLETWNLATPIFIDVSLMYIVLHTNNCTLTDVFFHARFENAIVGTEGPFKIFDLIAFYIEHFYKKLL